MVVISFPGATVTGDVVGVTRTGSGDTVVITSTAENVNYVLQGITTNGSVKFYSDKPAAVYFNGVGITNPSGAPINIQSKQQFDITLVDGTQNRLIDGAAYSFTENEDMKGAFFSEAPLEINGTGRLEIIAKYRHGIATDKNLYIKSGDIAIHTSSNAYWDADDKEVSASAGFKPKTALVIDGGTIAIRATGSGGKGINCGGDITITNGKLTIVTSGNLYAENGDDTAAKAIKGDGNVTVTGGTIKLKTTGTEAEGLESKDTLLISGGDLTIIVVDDCINAANHIEITGGTMYCVSSSNDAFDSNGTLTITGGTIRAFGGTNGEDGFDCDNNTFKITGGTLIGIGGRTSTPTSSVCTQPTVIYQMSGKPGEISIKDSSGTVLQSFTLPVTYNTPCLFFSDPALKIGGTYTIYADGTAGAPLSISQMVTSTATGGGNRPPPGPGKRTVW
ncbi:hypothetical protein FACS189445_2470 [Spirochaetia bacterium]|nr:hypothetical protein FACS189445_2470 [Spirochaetia bacterium]